MILPREKKKKKKDGEKINKQMKLVLWRSVFSPIDLTFKSEGVCFRGELSMTVIPTISVTSSRVDIWLE